MRRFLPSPVPDNQAFRLVTPALLTHSLMHPAPGVILGSISAIRRALCPRMLHYLHEPSRMNTSRFVVCAPLERPSRDSSSAYAQADGSLSIPDGMPVALYRASPRLDTVFSFPPTKGCGCIHGGGRACWVVMLVCCDTPHTVVDGHFAQRSMPSFSAPYTQVDLLHLPSRAPCGPEAALDGPETWIRGIGTNS